MLIYEYTAVFLFVHNTMFIYVKKKLMLKVAICRINAVEVLLFLNFKLVN